MVAIQPQRDHGERWQGSFSGPRWICALLLAAIAAVAGCSPTLKPAATLTAAPLPAPEINVPGEIGPDSAVEWSIPPSTTTTYLSLRVDVEPQAGLTTTLVDAAGRTLAQGEVPPGGGHRQILITTLPAAPDLRLRLEAEQPAEYELRVNVLRPAREGESAALPGLRHLYLARTLFVQGLPADRYREALHLLTQAEAELADVAPGYQAYAVLQQGNAWLYLSETEKSLDVLRRAEALFESWLREHPRGDAHLPLKSWMMEAYGSHARVLADLGRPNEALPKLGRALELAAEQGENGLWHQAILLINRAFAYDTLGEQARAEADLELAIEIGDRHERLQWLGWTALVNLADLYRRQGRLAEALPLFRQAEQRQNKENPYKQEDLLLGAALGRFYLSTGQLDEAADLLQSTLDLARQLENREYEQKALRGLALLHRILGEPETSLALGRRAIQLADDLGLAEPAVVAQLDLSETLSDLGRTEEAITGLRRAAVQAEKGGLRGLHALTIRELARALARAGHFDKAREASVQAVSLAASLGERSVAQAAQAHGEILVRIGRYVDAEEHLVGALTATPAEESPLKYAEIQVWLGRATRGRGDLVAAQEHMGSAISTLEEIRGNLASPAARTRFLADRHGLYGERISILLDLAEQGIPGDWTRRALEVSEASRAQSLRDLLIRTRVDPAASSDHPDLAYRHTLQSDILSVYYDELAEPPSSDNEARHAELMRGVRRARRDFSELEREIRRRDPRYAELVHPEPLDRSGIRATVPADAAMLQFVLGEEASFMFVVRPDREAAFRLPGEDQIRHAVEGLRHSLNARDPRSRAQLTAHSRQLYQMLLAAAADELSDVERLIVVPDGPLHLLPFELLRRPDGRHGIESWEIGYAPSAAVLSLLQGYPTPPTWSPTLVAFAGPQVNGLGPGDEGEASRRPNSLRPLPGAIEEAQFIAGLFPGDASLYLGPDANQDNVLGNRQVGTARWVHFASHGLIREDQPGRSGIMLSPGTDGDDLLEVDEVFGLHLSAEVVVLSACETGLGREVRGEGILGLTRAFFHAGSRSVMVSLWAVGDRSTATLMRHFYAAMADGQSPAAALRSAKLIMIEAGNPPQDWAPFVAVGAVLGPPSRSY